MNAIKRKHIIQLLWKEEQKELKQGELQQAE
jgi:hypothetical protein